MKKSERIKTIIIVILAIAVIFLLLRSAQNSTYEEIDDRGLSNSPIDRPLTEKDCRTTKSRDKKDDCWRRLANQISSEEDNEQKAAATCTKISDIATHESCLTDISFEDPKTCELMKTKFTDPEKHYLNCLVFVTDDITLCEERLGKNDWTAYYNECVEDNAITAKECDELIHNDETRKSRCIRDLAKNTAECEIIPDSQIKAMCHKDFT